MNQVETQEPGVTVIPLEDRRLKLNARMQLAQDVFGCVVLVPAAWNRMHLTGAFNHIVGAVELTAVGAIIAAAIHELRTHHTDAPVEWTNLFAGIALLLESAVAIHAGGKVVRPSALAGITSIVLAFGNARLERRRRERRVIRIDDNALFLGLSKFRKVNLRWSDVASVEISNGALIIMPRNGRRVQLRLRWYSNATEIRAAVSDAAARHGIAVTRT